MPDIASWSCPGLGVTWGDGHRERGGGGGGGWQVRCNRGGNWDTHRCSMQERLLLAGKRRSEREERGARLP